MRHFRGSLLFASFLAGAPLLALSALPAQAQFSASIGFDSFHDTLSDYGDWLYSDRWGEVWRPLAQDRDPDWRPYWAGHWATTREYGWTWISDEGDWGDITYHYGRWIFDPDDGWLWLPGYVWSPAWVVWRSAGPDIGWMPMPPDDAFLRPGFSISIGFGDWSDIGGYYGYSRWYGPSFDDRRFGRLWVFVPGDRLWDPGYRRYALPQPQTINIVRNSRNITNYTVVNNVIVNRSVTVAAMGGGARAPQPVAANTVLRSTRWVAPVNQGAQIQNRARQDRPRGNGQIDSAPPPTPQQIRSLSTRPVPGPANRGNAAVPGRGGPDTANRGGPRHLYSQANAQELQSRARGAPSQPNAAPAPDAPQPGAQPARPGNTQVEQRNRDNSERDNNRGRGPERQQLPTAAPPSGPPPAERAPRAMPGQQPPAPPPVTNERPQAMPERAAPPPREMAPRAMTPREQPREPMQREQPPRSMEQRMPDRPQERTAPAPREMPPPREMAPREQPRPQAAPREQARPGGPPPERGQDRNPERGQDRGRDRNDDNR